MKRLSIVCGAALLLACGTARAGHVDAGLEAFLEQATPDEIVSSLVYMSRQVDTDGLTARLRAEKATPGQRHEAIIRALQDLARETQNELVAELNALQGRGGVQDFEAFWIGNIVRVDATPDVIRSLAKRDDVATVYLNYKVELIEPAFIGSKIDPGGVRAPETGIVAVRAPEVWAMGFTGEGMLVANLDTGVDGNHPALASRWAGVADPRYAGHPEWAWRDDLGNSNFPSDTHGHGTHTMGSVCGGAPGDEVGVAPGAYWIAGNTINQGVDDEFIAEVIGAFQWFSDPDGDPSTSWDVPTCCSNSWGLNEWWGIPPCDETFWVYLDQCEAAGCMIVFSAGNEAYSGLRRPADRATDDYRTLAVAAVNANNPSWPIADFSSRGPTNCTPDGTWATKPDIAAPGVDVRSAYPGGGYTTMSGTSMASPHVNGVVALIRQANPDLSMEQAKQIIYDTAYDLGDPGEDNDYGWGMIDAYEAVLLALSSTSLMFEFPDGRPDLIDPNGGTTIRVIVSGQAVEPLPGTGKLYYGTGGDFTQVAMDEVEPNVYDAVFPAFDCGATVYYYFSAETVDNEIIYNPYTAPEATYNALAYSGIEIMYEEMFDSDPGWTTEDQWAFGQPTGQGGEYGGPDPTSGYTGPNVYGYNLYGDYQNNLPERHLTSGAFDCSGMEGVHLKFWRWLGVEQPTYDHAYIRVSTNGTSWTTVWENGSEITDYDWVEMDLDISAVADDQPTVYLRWTMGTTDVGWMYCGWNIDDVRLTAFVCDEPDCPEDVNGTGMVDIDDIFDVLAHWGEGAGPYDVNDDGMVDIDDVFAILAAWGPC
ncbi:MAG: S8 family serine peptidase [Phycisphaerales bacterium]|nr:MAG: S8 family serine peptidase [Phycisphaerales bacterium]